MTDSPPANGASRRIAVTGASGFIGRHLTEAASSRGWEVLGTVRNGAGAGKVLEAGGRSVVLPEFNADALAPALQGIQAVVHLAMIGAERHGLTYEGVNVAGTRAVVVAARMAGVPRVVLFSGLGVARYGMSPHTTNRYFLSKLAAEVELYRSGLEAVVFRPSYVVGTGSEFLADLLRQMASGEVERVGDGAYRLQPISVHDAVGAVLASLERPAPLVMDLVGPEPVTCNEFVERLAQVARAQALLGPHRMREIPVEEAQRQAASGGYRGMLPDELDCLLCDEVADRRPIEALLGRRLTSLDAALAGAISPEGSGQWPEILRAPGEIGGRSG